MTSGAFSMAVARVATRIRVHDGPMTRQARNVGIMFADIAGSMRLYEAFGNRGALSAIEMCLGLISNVVAQHKGFVVKTIGDEIMACFPDAQETWSAAVQAQRKVEALPALPAAPTPIKMALRIGFDFGQAIENNGDFFGTTVNLAARMVQLAKRGQIITTGPGEAFLPPSHSFVTRGLDWVAVKGKPEGVQVVELLWNQEETTGRMTMIGLPTPPRAQERSNELRLSLGPRSWVYDGRSATLSIGREQMNDVVVPNSAASRNHATVERRRDRWVLIDHSSNGTFVRAAGENEIHLRREEYTLSREGLIGFGQPIGLNPAECLSFEIVRGGG